MLNLRESLGEPVSRIIDIRFIAVLEKKDGAV